MGTVVVDSSAVIALSNADDPLHSRASAIADRWIAPGVRALLPAAAYSEILVEPTRAGRDEDMVADLARAGFEVVPIDGAIARVAAMARADRRTLRLPDALVIATALAHEAELVTVDRRMAEAHRALAGARRRRAADARASRACGRRRASRSARRTSR